jgi:hypothetical protein
MFAHFHNLSGVDNFDAGIFAVVFGQFLAERCLIPGEKKPGDLRMLGKSHHGTSYGILRGMVTAHRVESDLHRPGCLVDNGSILSELASDFARPVKRLRR